MSLRINILLQNSAQFANMAKHSRKGKASEREATLCSLPRDIMGKIIRALSFKDKCSLELVGREFNTLLSNPSSAEGLWSTCDLMSDLNLNDHFDSKENVMG